jgi:hypothetical protein
VCNNVVPVLYLCVGPKGESVHGPQRRGLLCTCPQNTCPPHTPSSRTQVGYPHRQCFMCVTASLTFATHGRSLFCPQFAPRDTHGGPIPQFVAVRMGFATRIVATFACPQLMFCPDAELAVGLLSSQCGCNPEVVCVVGILIVDYKPHIHE